MQRFDVLIVGAGQAGGQVALELADAGYSGTVAVLGAEDVPPYERPPLSKGFLAGEVDRADVFLRPADSWAASGVELLLRTRVVAVDPRARTVTTANGEVIGYTNLVWAAGGRPRRLPNADANLDGVHYLRTLDDAERLRTAAAGARRAAVIGGGFIGLEVAAAFAQAGLDVTVIEAADRVLARVTSPAVSEYFAGLHRSHGVTVLEGRTVRALAHDGGAVSGVVLGDGTTIPAEVVVVVGIGLVPNVEPLLQAGAAGGAGVDVDAFGRTGLPGVYAAGDCASVSNRFTGHVRMRIESVQNAVEQGRTVARSILGDPRPLGAVPWFWSNQYDARFKTMGVPTRYDAAIVRGHPASGRFSVVYLRAGTAIAVDAVNNVRDYAQAKALIESEAAVDPESVRTVPLKELAKGNSARVA